MYPKSVIHTTDSFLMIISMISILEDSEEGKGESECAEMEGERASEGKLDARTQTKYVSPCGSILV